MIALAHHWEGFLKRMYHVLAGASAACIGLQQEILEQRIVIHILLRGFRCCKTRAI